MRNRKPNLKRDLAACQRELLDCRNTLHDQIAKHHSDREALGSRLRDAAAAKEKALRSEFQAQVDAFKAQLALEIGKAGLVLAERDYLRNLLERLTCATADANATLAARALRGEG